jgi:competence protein ComEA
MAPAGAAAPASPLTVHVSGAVAIPGVVRVPAGSRVADAIAAAGGIVPAADPGSVNLAAPVRDGQQVVVPRRGDGSSPTTADAGGIRLNTASVTELERLPGVGPVLAGRIAGYRDEHGPFDTVEGLLDVPGIGEVKLAALRDAVIVP